MATVTVAGPSPLSFCKPSSACYGRYSLLPHSQSTRKWAPSLSPFRDRKHAKKPFYRSGHSLFICLHSKFFLGQPLLLNAGYTGFRSQGRRRLVKASLFGVGAPEALVIGVVALLVFGPKGLAEVARTLGKSLRAFQPTIRELQEVSREFKNTLEQEIGLDELQSPSIDPSMSASQVMEREKMEQSCCCFRDIQRQVYDSYAGRTMLIHKEDIVSCQYFSIHKDMLRQRELENLNQFIKDSQIEDRRLLSPRTHG